MYKDFSTHLINLGGLTNGRSTTPYEEVAVCSQLTINIQQFLTYLINLRLGRTERSEAPPNLSLVLLSRERLAQRLAYLVIAKAPATHTLSVGAQASAAPRPIVCLPHPCRSVREGLQIKRRFCYLSSLRRALAFRSHYSFFSRVGVV